MSIKKTAAMALLLSLALIIFMVESYLPPLAPIAGVKLGLANIVTLTAIFLIGRREAFIILILRIFIASIFSGGVPGFMYSAAGGVLSFAAMATATCFLGENRVWVISVFGAIAHNMGQLCVACFVIGSLHTLWYAPVLIISAVLTGVFTGVAAQFSLSQLTKAGIIKKPPSE